MKNPVIEKRKPLKVYFPVKTITRGVMVNPEGTEIACRIVEGYAFVNEWVGDGVNLKRSAMVAATDDYLKWGAVREMHQPSAVGTATGTVSVRAEDAEEAESVTLGVVWDENGATLRSLVVDTDAMTKLDTGVYKGYSVGIRASVMRGNDVIACTWIENSLVDRPADPDAVITLVRAADTDLTAEHEVLRYWDENDHWVSGPYTFAQRIPQLEADDRESDTYSAFWYMMDSLRSIWQDGTVDQAAMVAQTLDEFVAYLKAEFASSTERAATLSGQVTTLLSRLAPSTEATEALQRVDTLTADLSRIQSKLSEAQATVKRAEDARVAAEAEATRLKAEVERLESLPDPTQPKPVKFVAPERTFLPNQDAEPNAATTLRAELATLTESLKTEENEVKRQQGVTRMQVLRQQIHEAEALQG